VKDHHSIVSGKPDVAFYSGARFKRGGKSKQTVLGKARAIMQPSVGEALRTRVERIRA